MIRDEELFQAAAKAAMLINESLPEADDCEHTFSPKFQKKMAKIQHKAKHPALYRTLHSAASVLLVLTLLFGSVLAVDAQARELVLGWSRKQSDTFYAYFFQGSTTDGEVAEYYPGWVPEGHTLYEVYEIEGGKWYIYHDEQGGITDFGYSTNPSGTAVYLFCTDYEQEEVFINGLPGTFYLAPTEKESSVIVWTDATGQTLFEVAAHVDRDVLIRMAEKIVKK